MLLQGRCIPDSERRIWTVSDEGAGGVLHQEVDRSDNVQNGVGSLLYKTCRVFSFLYMGDRQGRIQKSCLRGGGTWT